MLAIGLACVGIAHALVLRHEILGEVLKTYRGQTEPERQALERISQRA